MPILEIPIRNWNLVTSNNTSIASVNIRNTYKELKHFGFMLLSQVIMILEIPIRNWNLNN